MTIGKTRRRHLRCGIKINHKESTKSIEEKITSISTDSLTKDLGSFGTIGKEIVPPTSTARLPKFTGMKTYPKSVLKKLASKGTEEKDEGKKVEFYEDKPSKKGHIWLVKEMLIPIDRNLVVPFREVGIYPKDLKAAVEKYGKDHLILVDSKMNKGLHVFEDMRIGWNKEQWDAFIKTAYLYMLPQFQEVDFDSLR
jgi:hypothetical protein